MRRPLREAAHSYLHELEALTPSDLGGVADGQLILVAYRVALMLAEERPDFAHELRQELETWLPPQLREVQHRADRDLLASIPPAVLS